MQVSVGKDFQRLWDRHFPDEDLNNFYSAIFDVYSHSPDEQLKIDVVQAHAALYKHEYQLQNTDKETAIKDSVIAKALIQAIHEREGQHFVERGMRPFNSDAQPWLSGPEIQHTMELLEHTGVHYCDLNLLTRKAPDGRDCNEMHESKESLRLTNAELDVVRQEFGERTANMVSGHTDNSGLEPYAGQMIDHGLQEIVTNPNRKSMYPKTAEQIEAAKARLDARFKPEDLDV